MLRFENQKVFCLGTSENYSDKTGKTYYNLSYYDNGYAQRVGTTPEIYAMGAELQTKNISISGNIRFYKGGAFLEVDRVEVLK